MQPNYNANLMLREPHPHEELLGTLLTIPDLLKEYRFQLVPELFQDYGWLYSKMIEVEDEEGLSVKGLGIRLDINGAKLLQELRKVHINENRIPKLIEQMNKNALRDRLRRLSRMTLGELEDRETDADEILRNLQQNALSLNTSESMSLHNPEKDIEEWCEWLESIMNNPGLAYGLLTGITSMDNITTGWHRRDFSVVGARTSMGKSAFMIENVLRLNRMGYKCAVFSLEMSKRQMYNRMMANLMRVDAEVIRTGQLAAELLPKVHEKKRELSSIYVDDTRAVTADYISDMMRTLKRTRGLDMVVVDYLQDVKENGEMNDNSGSALSRVCRKLRKAAQENDCHVMGLSQVVRAVEDRQDKRPGNADLSGSTGIETSADVIALLYRDEYYNPSSDKKNILEVNFTKQRNGKLGKVELYYDRTQQRIEALQR